MARDPTEVKLQEDNTYSNADSASGLDWEFGKPDPADPEPTPASDNEEHNTQNDESPDPDTAKTKESESPKIPHKNTKTQTKVECTKIRCRIAKKLGNKVGMVNATIIIAASEGAKASGKNSSR